jgi:hypothetical protein
LLSNAAWISVALVAAFATAGCARTAVGGSITDGFQAEILADGVVTASEYERAALATKTCVEDEGWETGELEVGLDGFTLTFTVNWPTASDAAQEAALSDDASGSFGRCANDFLDHVEIAYATAQVPTGSERIQMFRDLTDCLAKAGIPDVPTGITDEELAVILVEHEANPNRPSIEPLLCRERYIALFMGE